MQKKIFLIILLSILSFGPLLAQLKVGLKGGAVLSTLRRDASLNLNGGTLGYLAGIMVKKNMGELGWFFQPEFQYVYLGDGDQKLSFVKIPLIIGFDVSDDVNIHIGYQPGWLVGASNDAKDSYKSMNHEISLGMDFMAGNKVLLGLRVNYGLTNLVEDPKEVKNYEVTTFTVDIYMAFLLFDSER